MLDYDNDGWLDLMNFVQRSGPGPSKKKKPARGACMPYAEPNLLSHNNGNGRFEDVSSSAGSAFSSLQVGRGAASAISTTMEGSTS